MTSEALTTPAHKTGRTANNPTQCQIANYTSILDAHGYVVTSSPVAGCERGFQAELYDAIFNINNALIQIWNAYEHQRGYRRNHLTKKALAKLHANLPEPAWGIEVKTGGAA